MQRPSASDAVVIDFETFADKKVGYSLAKMSTRAYIEDPRFDILSVAIAHGIEDDVWFYSKYGTDGGSLADAKRVLVEAAASGKWLVSHNTDFDGLILALNWGVRFAHIFDTVAWLRYRGFGWSLANGARVVGLNKEQAPSFDESSLIDDEKLEQFAYYNCKDVEISRALFHAAIADNFFSVLEFWATDVTSRENLHGISLDRAKAAALAQRFAANRDSELQRLCAEFSDFDSSKLRSTKGVVAFLKSAFNVDLTSLDKREPAVVALKSSDTDAGRFLRMREAIDTWERHSKKVALLASGPPRIYGQLHYHGAHTGRFTSGGINAERVNLQNMHKGGNPDFEDLALIRSIIIPDEDESFVSSDLATIEPRVLAFLAQQQDQIDRFAAGDDVYIYFISDLYPGIEIVKGKKNDHLRQLGKKAVLGLGYGQGKSGFLKKLRSEDPNVDSELSFRIHNQYHQKFHRISQLRWSYFRAFTNAFDSGLASKIGGCAFRRISASSGWGFTIEVRLPTERLLTYRSVQRTREVGPSGKLQHMYRYANDYQFDSTTKGTRSGNGKKVKCGDGRLRSQLLSQTLIENIVSAVARDVLVAQMWEIEQHVGLRARFSVHDEAVVATQRCTCPRRDDPRDRGVRIEDNHESGCPWIRGRKIVDRVMSKVPRCFGDLVGLPVACELSDTIRDSYGK